jgi:putative MATE family efflux protein
MNSSLELNTTALPPERKAGLAGLWSDLREAIAGTQQDFTKGSIGRAILLLAVPMVLEMSLESLFAICDVFFVSRLGSNAVATVGLTESMITIIYATGLGVSMATTATVARRIGEKNPKAAADTAVQAIALGVATSLPIGLIGLLFAPELLHLMGASDGIIRTGSRFTAIMLGGNVVIMLLFIINGVFRGAGDAAISMRVLWLANFINIILDPCFIFGLGPFPRLGVTGAAVATTIGRGTGVLFQVFTLLRARGRIKVTRNELRLNPEIMLRLLRISLGGIFQFLISTASWIGMVRLISSFGGAAVAGYTIAIRIIFFTILPSWGLSNAAATMVGQNLGAGKPDRAERSVWVTGFCNMVFLASVGVVFVFFAEPVIHLFTRESDVVPYSVTCLRYISFGYIAYAYGMVMVQAFNGAGDTGTPTVINFFCYWLFQIPLAYTLAFPAKMGANGVFLAIPISAALVAGVSMILFRRGSWKKQRV